MSRPKIGISANFMHADPDRALFRGKTLQYFEERMALSVWRAGAVAIPLLDFGDDATAQAAVDELDGLLLSGGADVAPASYGETALREQWGGDAIRDRVETDLVERSVAKGIPVLGICRGIQILNVALGGSLWQDLNEQVPDTLVHRDWHRYDSLGHGLRVDGGSWLASISAGRTELHVNSIHHQGLKDLGRCLQATAWAPDGVIEAVEHIDDNNWIVGVQWHPEWLEAERVGPDGDVQGWAAGATIFEAFVDVCGARLKSARLKSE